MVVVWGTSLSLRIELHYEQLATVHDISAPESLPGRVAAVVGLQSFPEI